MNLSQFTPHQLRTSASCESLCAAASPGRCAAPRPHSLSLRAGACCDACGGAIRERGESSERCRDQKAAKPARGPLVEHGHDTPHERKRNGRHGHQRGRGQIGHPARRADDVEQRGTDRRATRETRDILLAEIISYELGGGAESYLQQQQSVQEVSEIRV